MTPVDAFVAAVRAAFTVWPNVKVYDSLITGNTPPQYVAIYPVVDPATASQCGNVVDDSVQIRVTFVAAGAGQTLGQQVRGLSSRLNDQLLGKSLTVTGWDCDPIESDLANPPLADESDLDNPTVYETAGFRFLAIRTT